jgi:hypothetical protein
MDGSDIDSPLADDRQRPVNRAETPIFAQPGKGAFNPLAPPGLDGKAGAGQTGDDLVGDIKEPATPGRVGGCLVTGIDDDQRPARREGHATQQPAEATLSWMVAAWTHT